MPLILSLQLDAESQAHFDELRHQYFPPALNFLSAHVTLFHRLPDAHSDAILADLERLAAAQQQVSVTVTGIRSLGRGVAFTLDSNPLQDMRKKLAAIWQDWLTPQDRQPYRPHVTVQNKVTSEVARETLSALQASFAPFAMIGMGLELWEYRGGPWAHKQSFPFLSRVREVMWNDLNRSLCD